MSEALRTLEPMQLVTYDTELTAKLRAAIAAHERVEPGNVLISAGSSNGLALLFSCLRGGVVLLPSPCWSYYHNLSEVAGLPLASYPLVQLRDRFAVDLEAVERAIRRHGPTLTVFINPHMPTGALADRGALLRCAAQAGDGLVLVDEAYHGFSPDAVSLADQVRQVPNLIVSKTFSKAFGLAGIRIGYLIAGTSIIEQLEKATSPFGVPFVSARLALAALESAAYYDARAAELAQIKADFVARLTTMRDVQAYHSHGNFVLVELPDAEAAARADRAIRGHGIAVRSAGGYGLPSFLRISIGPASAMAQIADEIEHCQGGHGVG